MAKGGRPARRLSYCDLADGFVGGADAWDRSLGADQCVDALTPLCQFLSSNVQDGHILIRLTFPGLSEADALRSVRLFGTEVVPALREIIVNDVAQK
jgi:hypothetical protein